MLTIKVAPPTHLEFGLFQILVGGEDRTRTQVRALGVPTNLGYENRLTMGAWLGNQPPLPVEQMKERRLAGGRLLRAGGPNTAEIARELGVSHSTVNE